MLKKSPHKAGKKAVTKERVSRNKTHPACCAASNDWPSYLRLILIEW
jgi:hypothetical protein